MRILNLTKFYHPYRGGIETVCKNITDSNIEAGLTSDVLCANTVFKNEIDEVNGAKVYRSARILSAKSTSICPYMPSQLRKLIPEYDLIHVHFPDPMTALSLFLTKPNIPFIVHWHNDIIKQQNLMAFYGPLQRWCLENAKSIIVTTQTYFENSQDLLPFKDKVKIIPIGIPSDEPPKERSLSEIKNILTVGRLAYYKGIDVLIETAKLLPDNYHFRVVGDGELKELLQSKIEENNLSHKVRLVGQKVGQELRDEFSKSDLFCFPSKLKAESFGVVLIEAMTHSLPIVACNIPGSGVPWVTQHEVTGLNVSPQNPQDLADALTKVLENPTLYKIYSQNSYRRFQEVFKLNQMMDKIWKVYRK